VALSRCKMVRCMVCFRSAIQRNTMTQAGIATVSTWLITVVSIMISSIWAGSLSTTPATTQYIDSENTTIDPIMASRRKNCFVACNAWNENSAIILRIAEKKVSHKSVPCYDTASMGYKSVWLKVGMITAAKHTRGHRK
jgi:hypothetical protein